MQRAVANLRHLSAQSAGITAVQINAVTGAILLPNGVEIAPSLTQDEFCSSSIVKNADKIDYRTLPYVQYKFSGGNLDGIGLRTVLQFYDQLLLSTQFGADLYPPGKRDWSNYSLETEAETKLFHDRILTDLLGNSGKAFAISPHSLSSESQTLHETRIWKYSWGQVSSGHDFKGGGTNIVLSYGDRNEQASIAFQRLREHES